MVVTTPLRDAAGADHCTGPLFPGPKYTAGDRPYSVTTGDFNGDGVTDLATANTYLDDVSVCWVWGTVLLQPSYDSRQDLDPGLSRWATSTATA